MMLEKILQEIEGMPYPSEGIGCGIEDVEITDRYEAAAYGWDEAIERISEIIRSHMEDDGWIPCSERLPEESLSSVIGWDAYRRRCCFVQRWGGKWILGNDIEPVDIIAWRPLPEPYRQKEEN